MPSSKVVGFSLLCLLMSPTANAFAPSPLAASLRNFKSLSAARMRPAVRKSPVCMSMEGLEGAQMLLSAVQNVPFVDELTGDPQGFTAPLNHFGSVIGLWVLFALPVWSAAYKQAGAQNPEWLGVSQVLEDVPGIGRVAKAAPEYDGPTFGEGLAYVFSFLWKPPILIAWRPREDLNQDAMDPARDTVVSKLYKGLGGATDKAAVYDEEDQLLIKSEIQVFEETPLGKRREALAEANGWFDGNPAFGRSLIEFSEVTKKGKAFGEKTVSISKDELARLRAAASGAPAAAPSTPKAAPKAAPKPAPKPAVVARAAPSGAAAAAAKAAAEAAARARAAQEEAARKRAAAEAQAAAAKQQAAAAAAARAAATVAASRPAPASKVGMGTMPVPRAGASFTLTQPAKPLGTVPVAARAAPAPRAVTPPPAPRPTRAAPTAAVASDEKRRFSPADKLGKGLPVPVGDYDFPGMQLLFGEGTLKDGLIPKWAPEIEFDNWGNPLPTASEATKRAYQQKKKEKKLAELSNKSTYPYDPNDVLVK